MSKFLELCALCRCEVSVYYNRNKVYYEALTDYLEDQFREHPEERAEMGEDVIKKAIEMDTLFEVQAYPNTPISFVLCRHYDFEAACQVLIDEIADWKQN